jgi:hypothetical protein
MKTTLVSRYHPLLVTLHWLLAVLIIAMLCIGFLVLAPMASTDPQKTSCRLHCCAHPRRAFSPVRPQRRTVAADVVWPAWANVLGAGEITGQNGKAPFNDRSCAGLSGLVG